MTYLVGPCNLNWNKDSSMKTNRKSKFSQTGLLVYTQTFISCIFILWRKGWKVCFVKTEAWIRFDSIKLCDFKVIFLCFIRSLKSNGQLGFHQDWSHWNLYWSLSSTVRFQQLILREIGLWKNSLIRFGKSILVKKEEQKQKENIKELGR